MARRFKNTCVALLACLIASCSPATVEKPASTMPKQNVIMDAAEETVVFVRVNDNGFVVPFCGGTWVSETVLLTANHCVELYGRDVNKVKENERYDAVGDPIAFLVKDDVGRHIENVPVTSFRYGNVIKTYPENDLALVRVKQKLLHKVVKTDCMPNMEIGADVHIMSHVMGFIWSYSRGYVSAHRYEEMSGYEMDVVQVVTNAFPGMSGAAVLDEKGCLMGVASFMPSDMFMGNPSILFAAGYSPIKKLLASLRASQ